MLNKILRFLKENWILLLILSLGVFLRSYKPLELFMYSHDEDLAGWIVKDILVNHHLRLIGQQTSSVGIFIGPYFYYLQIPFYLLTKMDPAGVLLLPFLLGVFTIFSFYFIFSKIYNKRVGLIAALVYASSSVIVFTDRVPVPTMPEVLWTVWYLYGLIQILKGKQKAYILIGFLFGLIWSLNLSLAILSPLVILAQIFSKTKINFKFIFAGISFFILLMSPFFIFESRHNFQQTKAIFESFTTQKDYVAGTGKGFAKLDRVIQLVHTNTTKIFWDSANIPVTLTFYSLIIAFAILTYKKIFALPVALIFLFWQILNILFFTFNSINVSEYYLNGMNVIWIGIFSVAVAEMLNTKRWKLFGGGILILSLLLNLRSFFIMPINRSGYLERKALVSYIAQDSRSHGYPCISVSYITSPGNDLGYRYFFWLVKLHVNQSKSGSPVYSIVYPTRLVDRVDKNFGVLGLILPDYVKYNKKAVDYSCSGTDSNLSDPLFGYTQ